MKTLSILFILIIIFSDKSFSETNFAPTRVALCVSPTHGRQRQLMKNYREKLKITTEK